MDDSHLPVDNEDSEPDIGAVRSPIRPSRPDESNPSEPPPADNQTQLIQAITSDNLPEDPQAAIDAIRAKMEQSADEFATGKINQTQFSALYKYYGDKLTLIEKLMARNPESDVWKQAAAIEHTKFLRTHFEARPLYYAVFKYNNPEPLLTDGKASAEAVEEIDKLLHIMNTLKNRPPVGLARKIITDDQWLVLALGANGITFVVFSLQPSSDQTEWINQLHVDFERANRLLLERGVTTKARLVFPQRAILLPNHQS